MTINNGALAIFPSLELLSISTRNVRKAVEASTKEQNAEQRQKIEELAALIQSQGLLQNLVVIREDNGDGMHYGVVAGGRRLSALQLLARRGDIESDFPVPCIEIESEDALAASIAENSAREPMHPADEFEAFKAMHDAGKPVEDIAAAFGVSPIVVQRRLKLANVSPKLIKLYRKGEMNLEIVTAMSITDDRALQERTWKNASHWQRNADHIRHILTKGMVGTKDDVAARFVGLTAYEAAGGTVVRDLFAGPDDGYMADEKLVARLVQEKLDAAAAKLRAEGWSWVTIVEGKIGWSDTNQFGRSKPSSRELTVEESDAVTALRAKLDDLNIRVNALADEGDDDASEELAEQAEDLEEEIKATGAQAEEFSDRQKKKAGVVLGLNYSGVLEIHRGLIRPDAKPQAKADAVADKAPRPVHSESLINRLSAHRSAALSAHLLEAPRVALDLLCSILARRIFYAESGYDTACLQIEPRQKLPDLPRLADDIEASSAWAAIERQRADLRKLMPEKADGLFEWLGEQSITDVVDILCFCTASCLTGVTGSEKNIPLADLQTALGLDMADWWQPTAAGYLKYVRKDVVIAAVTEMAGKHDGVQLEKLKKGEIDRRAEELLVDTRWLPTVLKSPAAPKPKAPRKPKASPEKAATAVKKTPVKRSSGTAGKVGLDPAATWPFATEDRP